MSGKLTCIQHAVEQLSQIPIVFDSLRWILEAGFVEHRRLIERAFQISRKRVLDCGCGTGIYANCFPAESYTGIDISAKYIERARMLNPNHCFEVMDALSLLFTDESFDAVIVSGVVHHLSAEASNTLLKEVWRVLRPGGMLLLWEDVPTRSQLNVIGHLVHRLDVGQHIREADLYKELLTPNYEINRIDAFRSGCMDYVAFTATKVMQLFARVDCSVVATHADIEFAHHLDTAKVG